MRKQHDLAGDVDGLIGPPESDVLGMVGRAFGPVMLNNRTAVLKAPRRRLYCSKCDARLVCSKCGDYYRNCTGPSACACPCEAPACPDCDLAVVEVHDRGGAVVGLLRGVCSEPAAKRLPAPGKARSR